MLFSIGIPAYKSTFLEECIQSVLSQTYTLFELIIVNDDSPEPIDEIVRLFSDDRIKYVTNPSNIGARNVVDNWNKCLEHARGEFFVLLGDDDRLEPDFLEVFVQLIQKFPNLDVYHCRSKIINESSQVIGYTYSCPEFESVYENIWHRMRYLRLQYVSDYMYRTEALKWNGGYYKLPLAWISDDISAYRVMGEKGVAHTQKPVFCYRRNAQTISNTGNTLFKLEAVVGEEQWLKGFLEQVPLNAMDCILHQNISEHLARYSKDKKVGLMTQTDSFRRFPAFIRRRKDYGCSWMDVVLAFVLKCGCSWRKKNK